MTALVPTSLTLGKKLSSASDQAQAFDAMWQALWTQDVVPPALLECCRLRLAQMHRVDAELEVANAQAALPKAKAEALLHGDYLSDPHFSAGERAVLAFAEIYAQDPAALTDDLADAVKEHYGEPGLVVLVKALGFIDGRIRMARLFGNLINQA